MPEALTPNIDVPEHKPVFTGLLDKDGDEIWSQPRTIGFGCMDEFD